MLKRISMSKRNIAYTKPRDPKFLQQLKQQIGYSEGPSVETKKQKLEDLICEPNNEKNVEREDEKPQIVVINPGDLTAEEVLIEEKRLAKEVAETPADLSKPIVFRRRHKPTEDLGSETLLPSTKNTKDVKRIQDKKSSEKSSNKITSKLSFNVDEEE